MFLFFFFARMFSVQWSQTAITCQTPPGVGQLFAVVVRVLTLCGTIGCNSDSQLIQDARNLAFNVSYNPPTVQSVSPVRGPTAGQYNVSLKGTSFGNVSTRATATLHVISNGKPATLNLPIVAINHSLMVVTMAPAAGTFLNISVLVSGQVGWLYNAWSYDPPVITEIRPNSNRNLSALVSCTQGQQPCVHNWLPAHSADVVIEGYNFGTEETFARLPPDLSNPNRTAVDINITIGGKPCIPRGADPIYFSNTRFV